MNNATIQRTFDAASKAHQQGRLQEAEQIYQSILAAQPNHADSIHMLGVMAQQTGRSELALNLIRRALALNAFNPNYHTNLGMVLMSLGRVDDAITCHRRAVALRADYGAGWNNLGVALSEKGQTDEAAEAWKNAVKYDPNASDPKNNLASILLDKGKSDEALKLIQQALALRPDNPDALHNLGVALRNKGRLEESVAAFQKAITHRPNRAETHNDLGITLQKSKRPEEAMHAFSQAVALKPTMKAARNNLGHILRELHRHEESGQAYAQIIQQDPDFPDVMNNFGRALHDSGRIADSLRQFDAAVARHPNDAAAHWNMGLLQLMHGDFVNGWREYEHRYDVGEFTHFRDLPRPLWDGSDLNGRKLLLFAEQGFGDTIQQIRFIPQLVQRVGPVSLIAQEEVRRLLEGFPGVENLYCVGDKVPKFDVFCSLLSLPLWLNTRVETIPHDVPYLRADAALGEKWKSRMAGLENRFKIGIAWAGRPSHPNDYRRTIPLSRFASLAQNPRAWFCSLQKGEAAAQAKNPPPGMELVDWTADISDFADTAALIDQLDLVISVDTAPVHLAGALAKPVWVLLPYPPDWRWLLDRTDSPWYPTMRLFRQKRIDDWDAPWNELTQALAERLA